MKPGAGLFALAMLSALTAFIAFPQSAEATRFGFLDPQWPLLQKAIRDALDCPTFKPEDAVSISFGLGRDVRFYDAAVTKFAENPQITASCLEAVCCTSPFLLYNNQSGDLDHIHMDFGPAEAAPHYDASDIAKYRGNYPKRPARLPRGDNYYYAAIHTIPVDVLRRYPGLFTVDEIISAENLTMIGIGDFDHPAKGARAASDPLWVKRIKIHYRFWTDQFIEHPNMTKQEIIDLKWRLPRV